MTDGAARGDRDIRARGGCSHGVGAGVRSPTMHRQKTEQRDGHGGQRVARAACPGRCSEVPHAADLSWARTGRDHGSLSGPDCDSSHAALTSRKRQRKPSDPSRHRQEVLESTRWVVRVCAGQSTHRLLVPLTSEPVPGEARFRRPGRRSHIGCPRWSCGSHLACAARASPRGQERLKRGLPSSKQRCPPDSTTVRDRAEGQG